VFVYSGQGSHWAGMGRQLLADEPVFANAVAELEPTFLEQVGFSLKQVLSDGEAVRGDALVQPVLVGLQLALTALWRSYGVHPDAVIGHSVGEVSAAVVAGALGVSDGFKVVASRSRLMSRLAGRGAVALLKLDPAAASAAIAEYPQVSIAGYLTTHQTVIAGIPDQVDAVIAVVSGQNRFARRVNMEVASHTALMDEILPELRAELSELGPNPPGIPFFSTVLEPTSVPVLDADYWVANVRRPVRFADAVVAAGVDHGTFIEISAHPMLTQAVTETLEPAHHHGIGTLRRDGDDTLTFHASLNAAHLAQPRSTLHPPEPHPVLPNTPWHRTRHWITAPKPRRASAPGGVPGDWYGELTWPVRALPAAAISTKASWLVVAESAIGAEISGLLDTGAHVTVLPPSALSRQADSAELVNELAGMSHVLYAPEVASNGLDAESGYRLFHSARNLTAAMARMLLPPKLFLVTRDAQPLSEGEAANPAQAVLWGLGRTLALEHPEIWGAVVDVDGSAPAQHVARLVLAEAHSGDGEDQVVYRDGARHVPRLSDSPKTIAI
jgi:phthiocerol/phenolphthiocerol synthesis type-I polyketide synthase B